MELINNQYTIGGVKVSEVAAEFGTLVYIYDASTIKNQVETFKKAFEGINLQIKYAMKANSNISILKLMKKLGTGIDSVSIPEIEMALIAGFKPGEIVFTPNVVDFEEIRQAIKIGTAINIENLSNLEKLGIEYGSSVPCFIRLNPNIIAEAESQKVEAWHKQSKFGISLNQFDKLREIVHKYKICVNGIHLHSSHVIMSKDVFLKGAKIIFDLAKEFPDLEYFDFGGGISVVPSDDDKVFSISDLGDLFKKVFSEFCKEYGRELQLWFEPGRFLVSTAGYLLSTAEILKTNGQTDFVGINSGFSHLIRPMFYNAWHKIVNISNPGGKEKEYTIVGNLCEIDNFAKNRLMNEVREKDLLIIENAGAYGFSMSSHYNSRPKPSEVMIVNGEAKLIRKRDGLDDFLRNQVEIEY